MEWPATTHKHGVDRIFAFLRGKRHITGNMKKMPYEVLPIHLCIDQGLKYHWILQTTSKNRGDPDQSDLRLRCSNVV